MRYTNLIDSTGSIIWADYLKDRSQRDPEEIVCHKFWEFVEPQDRDVVERAFAQAAWKHCFSTCEARVLDTPDKSPVELHFSPVEVGDSCLIVTHVHVREDPEDALTTREVEIVKLLCCDMTSAEIGEQLGIATSTVDSHAANIRRKLGVHGLAGMALAAARSRLIEL